MKKILLFFVVALLVGCAKDYTSDFSAIDERLDKLEEAVPSIEEQIDSIKAQLKSLKETDKEIKEQIEELKLSNELTAEELANLKAKDEALEGSINDLQKYVDDEIAKAKSEAAAAYATVEQYNTIVTQLNALQGSTDKLGEELTAKINAEVKSLTDKIAELEARLKAVEDKVESLLARIQSVSYIPEYADGKVVVNRMGSTSYGKLSFRISPKDAVVELEKVWSEALSCEAYYPKTRAVSLVKLAVTEYVADAESGVITVKISGEGLSDEFFAGTQEAKVALVISDGNNQVVSDYADMFGKEIYDEIWYKTVDNQPLTPHKEGVDIFGANLISNTYNEESGWYVLKFDAPVTTIGEQAFGVGSSSNTTVSTLQNIVIPNTVTSIAKHAFAYCCDELLSIVIPDSVTSIGRTAFANLDKLESVTLGKNVESLGLYTFSWCTSLKSINIPEKITVIPDYCFRYCESLTNIAIHDKIVSIGSDAFLSCSSLGRVDITDLAAWCNIEMSDAQSSPINEGHSDLYLNGTLITDLVIPAGVTDIKSLVFYDSKFTTITIPESVTSIGDGAFGCLRSTTVFYGKFATEDHRSLIVGNKLLGVAQAGLTSYRVPDGVTSIGGWIFPHTDINSITIPSSITTLTGENLFHKLDYDSIVIFEGTTPPTGENKYSISSTTIEGTIFVPVEAVDVYKSAWTSLADYIRPYEEDMNVITYTSTDGNIVTPHSEDEVTEFRTIKEIFGASLVSNTYENGVGKMVFDGPVTVIRKGAFNSIKTLKTIILPNGIKRLGEKTFQYCHALESIKLPDNLTRIYMEAFHQCYALTELTIPDSVTSIGTQTFFNCPKLEYIYSKFSTPDNMTLVVDGVLRWVSRCYPAGDYKIPEGVTMIGDYAIGYPNNVITVTIPESVETCGNKPIIGAYNISAFYGKYTVDNRHFIKDEILYSAAVHGLTEYEVPEGVKGTGYRIFRACKFTKVTLPASLEKIGDNIFENCEKLQGVYCKAIVPPAQGEDYDIFVLCSNIPTIYVPRVSVEAYKTATGWSKYADKIVGYDF